MTEEEYLSQIHDITSDCDREVPLEAIELIDQAIQEHPNSECLWLKRGDLIQLGPEGSPHKLEVALLSYKRAIKINPNSVEACEEIGHYFNAIIDDEIEAKKWFEKARTIRNTR
ncbi:MAG TPA: hypothetical protein QF468_03275 [Nitrospinota bacterium]|jgi:tetratricopeptide (TPR) repeat protein|nr:hypothetical protein [Nitrospinota bacterium]|tara:strand:+ start:2971 stop:3312 length:342 start_codon:yes stop_codon:yes gene_type:complete